jgi:ATP-dependent Clp protease ATP-binding subunit ClpB
VGYEEGGQLTEAVRRRPYAVILFDEVEKAHPDVFNVMLQILDDGRVTDGQGRTVDFTNTVLILTSNIGSQSILDLAGDPARHSEMESRVNDALRGHFRPEFLNRLDETIIFHSLKQEELREIVELQVQRLARRLEDKKLELQLNADALDWLAGVGYDPVYGARPLKRAIQRELETPIAKGILAGQFTEGHTISVDVEGEAGHKQLRFQQSDPAKLPVLVFPQGTLLSTKKDRAETIYLIKRGTVEVLVPLSATESAQAEAADAAAAAAEAEGSVSARLSLPRVPSADGSIHYRLVTTRGAVGESPAP